MMLCLSYGVSRGVPLADLCRASGIEPRDLTDPLRMLPVRHTERMWRALVESLPDENVALGVGTLARLEHYGFLFQAARHVGSGLELLQVFARLLSHTDTACLSDPVRVSERAEEVELRWPPALKLGMPERTETLNIGLLTLLRSRMHPALTPRRVLAAHPPDDKRTAAAAFYGCHVEWSCDRDAICFDHDVMLARWPDAQPTAVASMLALVERELASSECSFSERVRHELGARLAHGDATQQALARALGLSVRSLQRKLRQQGTSYGQALGNAQRAVGEPLFRDLRYSIEAIGAKLGYSDPSAFSRGWKRLTGESPARYRARLLGRTLR